MKFIAGAGIFLMLGSAQAADLENGDDLHFEHCTGCHDSAVYTRASRNVQSLDRLGTQVRFCKNSLSLTWFDDEVDDVIAYLNQAYYHF
ncbi:MAG: cytochrome c [Gammaproteobacteria bacterium]|nr:cytochrome c [Gammaproteobacteria bacterium]MCP4980287.1 cytochrome c [Gammaproteobacteria bacterium]